MKKIFAIFSILLLSFIFAACDDDQPSEEVAPIGEEATVDDSAEEVAAEPESEELEMVAVADDGTEFDPPVQPEQLPDGVYYCDMGTVHYARAVNSEHRCPICNMMLTHKGDEDADEHDH